MIPGPIPGEDVGAIASVEAIHIAVPSVYGGPPPKRPPQWPLLHQLLLRVETDKGLIGWGESFGHTSCATTRTAVETLVAPLCIGKRSDEFATLAEHLRRSLHTFGLDGPLAYAISGIEIALQDIAAKSRQQPLFALLNNGEGQGNVPAYASLLRYDDPQLVGQAAADAVSRGHHAVKLHEANVESVAAAREALGPGVALTLDVNCRWSPDEAVETARKLKRYDLAWIEEPCWPPHPEHLAMIGEKSGVPMAAGENAGSLAELERIAVQGRASYLQPSVTKLGGVSALLAANEIARRHGARVATHSAYFGPGLAATLHFCSAFGLDCEWYDCRLEANVAGLLPRYGAFEIPGSAGLGVKVDEDLLRDYRLS